MKQVAAPYGTVASAAWTLFLGGLSLVIFYSLLSRQGSGAVAAFLRAIGGGFRRFTDPWSPLFPTAGESATPATTSKPSRAQANKATKKAISHAAGKIRTGGQQ